MDITEVILHQHSEQRRMFGLLDEMPRGDTEALGAVWARLAVFLEVHAEAEERYFYPRLLKLGQGNPEGDVDEEVEDAIKDHNDHMAEEEREDLLDFRHHADLQTRHDIAVQFLTYEAKHYAGIPIRDKDPQQYIEQNS